MNVKEKENEFEIELAVPGMKKEDFKIELDKHVLTISSEQTQEKEEKTKTGNIRGENSTTGHSAAHLHYLLMWWKAIRLLQDIRMEFCR